MDETWVVHVLYSVQCLEYNVCNRGGSMLSSQFCKSNVGYAFRLPTILHPQPYKLWWLGSYVQITHQVKVNFSICGCSDSAMFDVMSMHMKFCSLVIGKPWT